MFQSLPGRLPVGLWVVAVLGAVAVLVGPLTPWNLPIVAAGLATCLTASTALTLWFVRR
jgi:hypothetical protein